MNPRVACERDVAAATSHAARRSGSRLPTLSTGDVDKHRISTVFSGESLTDARVLTITESRGSKELSGGLAADQPDA